MSVGDKKPAAHHRLIIHLILLTGALFFLLPLVWMIATSLKPLDQTMKRPEDLATAFLAWFKDDDTNGDVNPNGNGNAHARPAAPHKKAMGRTRFKG